MREIYFSKTNHVRFAFPAAEPDVRVWKKTSGNPGVTAVYAPWHFQANLKSRPNPNPVYVACSLAPKSRRRGLMPSSRLLRIICLLQITPLPADSSSHVLAQATCVQKRYKPATCTSRAASCILLVLSSLVICLLLCGEHLTVPPVSATALLARKQLSIK